jgi:hypothetical protein
MLELKRRLEFLLRQPGQSEVENNQWHRSRSEQAQYTGAPAIAAFQMIRKLA